MAGWGLFSRVAPKSDGPEEADRSAVAVVAVPIATGEMVLRSEYPGEVFADAVEISSRIAGHVRGLEVRLGDEVTAEQVLGRIDVAIVQRMLRETRAQLDAQKAAMQSAAVNEEAARREFERVEQLFERGAVSQQEMDDLRTMLQRRQAERATSTAQAEAARARLGVLQEDLKDSTIRAPFAGTIARRDVDPGAFVQPGDPLLRLVATDPLRVRFRIPEYDIGQIAEEQPFTLESRTAGDGPPTGKVKRLSGEVSANDRTLLVEGVLDPGSKLRPGMYVDVIVDRGRLEDATVVPSAAVLERVDSSGRTSIGVFVVERGVARWIDIKVLGREGERTAVAPLGEDERALDPSMRVLVRGHRDLGDGAHIRVVEGEEPPK